MKKSQNKKRLSIIKSNKLISVLVALLLIVQVISITYIFTLQDAVVRLDNRAFLSLVNQSEARRYKNSVIDIHEQKIYIPDAHIYIPLNDVDPQIMYHPAESTSKTLDTVYLSTEKIVGNQYSLTQYESCDKLITISSTKRSYGTFIKEITPRTNELRYVYLYDKSDCSIYTEEYFKYIKNIAKSIQSY